MKVFRCKILSGVGLTVVLALGVVSTAWAQPKMAGPTNPKIYGRTIGEWSAKWWNWVSSAPVSETPLLQEGDVDCGFGQEPGKVWFLGGTFGGDAVRNCTIPKSKALFFPLVNSIAAPDDCSTVDECRELAASFLEPPVDLFCTIDGVPCAFQNLLIRTQSPPFTLLVPEGSVFPELFGFPAGDRFPAIADGFWVMLPPLSAGEHVLRFGGTVGCPAGFEVDVTYNLTVE